MAEIEDKKDSKTLREISSKLGDLSENTIGATRKLGDNLNDAFRATFADSPLIASIVDIGESMGKDVLGLFKGEKKEPLTEAEISAAEQRKEQREELKQVTQALEAAKNEELDSTKMLRTDNEQIIDNLEDIKEVWDAGNNAEERREQARRDEERLRLEERRNELLEALTAKTAEKEEGEKGFFDKIKDNLVLTMAGLVAFMKAPFANFLKFFKPFAGMMGKFLKVLGPIGLLIGTVIGAFTGFNKATEIFGENASILDKVVSSLAGIISGFTFGLIDIEPVAKGLKEASLFLYDTLQPFVTSMGAFFGSLWDTIGSGVSLLTSLFSGTPSEVDAAWDTFMGTFTNMGEKFMGVLKELGGLVQEWFTAIPKFIFEQLVNAGGFIGEAIAGYFTDTKTEGEEIYDKLEDSGVLEDRYGRSDTLTQDAINKLSAAENTKLQNYLIESGNADKRSKIIEDLQAQLEKSKKESPKTETPASNVVDASSVISNTNNFINQKQTARDHDNTSKLATLTR